jgi:hypothetical protein
MEGYSGASRPAPNVYLRMDDRELMALRVTIPGPDEDGNRPDGTERNFVFVQASIRGTECSGGHFNLYDDRHAVDGRQIIEWIAAQSWSNKAVGMVGGSFPGQTAYWVAAAKPDHLKAVMPSLLHSDIYRDIFMPGGVQNILFPSLWTYGMGVAAGPHRVPIDSVRNQTIPNDEICTQAEASRYGVGDLFQPQLEPVWRGIEGVDNDWYHDHAALDVADNIKIPYYQQGNWQDEQVGPRAVVLFHHIHPDLVDICDKDGNPISVIPKKFALSSGDHGNGGFYNADRWAWFDMFLRGKCDAKGLLATPIDADGRPANAVVNYFETVNSTTYVTRKSAPAWPFPDTDWQQWYIHDGGVLDENLPGAAEGQDTYLSGIPRRGWFWYEEYRPSPIPATPAHLGNDLTQARSLPDNVSYETAPLSDNLIVAGPVMIDLWASMIGTDADFFVTVSDVWPDGSISYIARGLLKASHRAIDPARSYYVDASGETCVGYTKQDPDLSCDNAGYTLVQPYRPHTNPQPVTPLDINRYQIEIFPIGHIFRKDHKILVQVYTPPQVDGLWGYTATQHQPAAVTIYHDDAHRSVLQLPVVPTTDTPIPSTPPTDCRVPAGFPCTPPSMLDAILSP